MARRSGVFLEREERDRGAVVRLWVSQPGKINVLGTPILEQFHCALDELQQDREARVVVLSGAGDRAFIGGADIREMAGFDGTSARTFITLLHGVCRKLRELRVPVVARIRGHCLGAGLEVAAACDLRVASAGSLFGMPEVLVGVPSVIEAALLPRLMGEGRAQEIMLTGRTFGAEEALSMGLIHQVARPEDLDQELDALVNSLLEAAPRALALQKELFREWQERPLQGAIEAGIEAFERAYETAEPGERMQRFLSRPRS